MSSADSSADCAKASWRTWVILGGLMVLLLCLRLFPGWFYVVIPDGEFRLPDPDAYFHFRQATYALEHFPQLQRFDDLSHYPAVLRNDAAGLYDLTLAGLAKLVAVGGMEPMRALWWVCLWFPPLAVTAILPLVYLLVRRQGSVAIAVTMALWYLLLPGKTLANMTIGVCDHHVVEMLISVWCILQLQQLAVRERTQPTRWWRPAWGAALPLAILQFTWIGGPLFLVIFGLAGAGQLVADIVAGAGARAQVRAGVRYWSAFFILAGATGILFPSLIILPDLWKASLAGAAGVIAATAASGWFFETPRLKLRPAARLAMGAACIISLSGLAFSHSPAVQDYVGAGLGPKSLLVEENQVVTASFYFGVTGLAGILGLLAPLAGIVAGVWRRPGWWAGVLPSLLFIALWYRTYDYSYQGALHAVILTGSFFSAIAVWLSPAPGRPQWQAAAPALAASTVAVILVCWQGKRTAPWWMPGEWYATASGLPNDGWLEAMRWLRANTPAPPPLPARLVPGQLSRGRVGVLTDWGHGHYVNTLAERPATSSRYPGADGLVPFFLKSEDAVRAAALRGSTIADAVRYVAIDPRTIADSLAGHRAVIGLEVGTSSGRTTLVNGQGRSISMPTLGAAYDSAFANRLLIADGNGYAHFRLIFESRQQSFLRLTRAPQTGVIIPRASPVLSAADRAAAIEKMHLGIWQEKGSDAYLGHLLAAVKIFEQVEGAKVEGRAPPGATVVLQIPLRLRTSGRSWLYRQSSRADANGNFRLTVPYATEPAPGTDLVPAGLAELMLAGEPVVAGGAPAFPKEVLTISETAVQNGQRVSWRGWLNSPGT